MKKVVLLGLLIGLIGLAGCKTKGGGGKAELNSDFLIGTWETQNLTIDIPAKNNSGKGSEVTLFPFPDSTKTEKPITILAQDGKYRELVVNGSGETVNNREGFWHFYSDTLVVRMESNGNVETKFGVVKKGSKLILTNRVDWTANGKKEETMRLELKKR